MITITAMEASKLLCITDKAVRKKVKNGTLKGEMTLNNKNRPKCMVYVDSLPDEMKERYYDQQKGNDSKAVDKKPLDSFSAHERDEISKWIKILMQWQEYRNTQKSKVQADADFIAGMKLQGLHLSTDILYRRWTAYKNDDLNGLIEKRGKCRKGKTKINDEVWKVFCSFYLSENRPSMRKCLEYTELWLKENRPELVSTLPDYTTITRYVKKLPKAVETLGRDGEKAFHDKCTPYIKRDYNDMLPNDYWIADNHTFDVITQDATGKPHRLYLTAFFDARTGIFTGSYVTHAPNSQATLIALRNGILKYGIPKNIYVDNGREFLTFDVGGLGHRQKKSTKDRFDPPPVFERLGIKMINAIVKNARAKTIERRFLDVKEGFSKLFDTYTGGTVCERPEKLKKELKDGNIVLDEDFIKTVNDMLEGHFNFEKYNGSVLKDKGKRKIDIFNEYLSTKRVASEQDLNLMLMRSTRSQKVGRRGVYLTIASQRLDYYNQDLLVNMLDKSVYLRYDPEDLTKVRVYDLDDRYVMEVPIDNQTILTYGAKVEDIKNAMGYTRRLKKAQKETMKSYLHPEINSQTALNLLLMEALANTKSDVASKPEDMDIDVHTANEKPLLHDVTVSSIDRMVENATRRSIENGGH